MLHLKAGDKIKMGEYGTLKKEDFFNSKMYPRDYDKNYDHNILEITGVIKNK